MNPVLRWQVCNGCSPESEGNPALWHWPFSVVETLLSWPVSSYRRGISASVRWGRRAHGQPQGLQGPAPAHHRRGRQWAVHTSTVPHPHPSPGNCEVQEAGHSFRSSLPLVSARALRRTSDDFDCKRKRLAVCSPSPPQMVSILW